MYEAQIFLSVLEKVGEQPSRNSDDETRKDVAVAQAGWSKAESGTADITI